MVTIFGTLKLFKNVTFLTNKWFIARTPFYRTPPVSTSKTVAKGHVTNFRN